jgi:hypothetical protein
MLTRVANGDSNEVSVRTLQSSARRVVTTHVAGRRGRAWEIHHLDITANNLALPTNWSGCRVIGTAIAKRFRGLFRQACSRIQP